MRLKALFAALVLLIATTVHGGFISQPISGTVDESANYNFTGIIDITAGTLKIPTGGDTDGFLLQTAVGTHTLIKSNLAASVAPTANEDSADGYDIGSRWIDTVAAKVYEAVDVTEGAAVWKDLTASGAGGCTDLDNCFDAGKEINGASSFANAFRVHDNVANPTNPSGIAIYTHASNGPTVNCYVDGVENDCDYVRAINTGNKVGWKAEGEGDNGIEITAADSDALNFRESAAAPTTPASGRQTLYLSALTATKAGTASTNVGVVLNKTAASTSALNPIPLWKEADEGRSATTISDDTDFSFVPPASTNWIGRCSLYLTGSAETADFKLGFTEGGATGNWAISSYPAGLTDASNGYCGGTTPCAILKGGAALSSDSGTLGVDDGVDTLIDLTLSLSASASPTAFTFQWSSAGTGTTTMLKGSHCIMTMVPF